MSSETEITYIEGQIEQSKMMALWHMFSTVNGNTARRIVSRGSHRLTEPELIDDAMETAMRHIHRIEELNDARAALMKGR